LRSRNPRSVAGLCVVVSVKSMGQAYRTASRFAIPNPDFVLSAPAPTLLVEALRICFLASSTIQKDTPPAAAKI
jgi:hypothetical protein